MNKRQAKKALKKSGTLLSEELPMISLTKENLTEITQILIANPNITERNGRKIKV